MAQFTAQGRLKPLFNGERMPFGLEPKDPSCHYKLSGVGGAGGGLTFTDTYRALLHKRKLRFIGSGTRVFFSSVNKSNHLNAEARLNIGSYGIYDENDDFDELERDELACFRGLVLDISYRPVNVVCWKRAICLEFLEKADVLEYYDQTVNSPSGSFYIPAVLRVCKIEEHLWFRIYCRLLREGE